MPWTFHSAIRCRREALGLSQDDVAKQLHATKSHLSLIESGKRKPTEEQIARLGTILAMPRELLFLGSGRLPEDVSGVFQTDAAEAIAAVRQRIEAYALNHPTSPSKIPLPKSTPAPNLSAKLSKRMDVHKTSTAFRTHSYHTKVPPEAIRPFIRAFTRPYETIIDPFCGSGMTGVAALMEGRHAILSDLSPAAVHIARNYTTPCDVGELEASLRRVEQAVASTMTWLYRPIGTSRTVEYTTWSDIYLCPACQHQITYWDAVNREGAIEGDRLICPYCSKHSRKADLEWIGERPVVSHTSCGSNRIDSHPPTREEMALIEEAASAPIPYWVPIVPFGSDREMWRAAHRAMGISDISGFYTRRNMHALAALRHVIVTVAEGRVREALLFAFTAAVNRASKRYQWNAKRPTNVMTGTLYISSLRYEWNVWSLFRRKAADVLRYYKSFPPTTTTADVFQRSATDLDCIPDGSVDMVFMDPPFGANIFYADSSLLWESWLGSLMDQNSEIVINKHRGSSSGGKKLEDYAELLQKSFCHAARILKPGGKAILAFSNSDDNVWEAVQKGLREAGFKTSSVHMLNKGQPSIKGVKGLTGKEHVTTWDLILCLDHKIHGTRTVSPCSPPAHLVDQIIRKALTSKSGRTDEVYSTVIRSMIEAGHSVSGITMPAIAERCRKLGAVERAGKWNLIAPRTSQSDFISGYITSDEELPVSCGSPAPENSLPKLRIVGGRGSTFYLAHSYHTKLPPETIQPFIEHYTKPGDVVLDPFCGSGMTGLAAALSGRKAILSDLSPAAVHLAWNHTRPCDPEALKEGFSTIASRLEKHFQRLYGTTHTDGQAGVIHWTLWSTKHRCPCCSHDFLLWDIMDRTTGRLGNVIACPKCKNDLRRSELKDLGSVPAWIAYENKDGKRFEKEPEEDDVKRAVTHRRESINVWYPQTPVAPDREMYIRCALHLRGVETIADFYTSRNLEALGLLWQEINSFPNERIRQALAFAFTNTAWHGTRMRRFNARGGQRPLTGTLYIPQLSSEANVLEVMRNKIEQLQRYYRSYRPPSVDLPALMLENATKLSKIPNESIDYVFTDPPFGSNIFYADCNLIWESWLGRLTDVTKEAVVNRSLGVDKGGKSLESYAGLIGEAMREIARVLKPGGWATVVFHNTDANVWHAIRDAARGAGFSFHEAASLDRRQQSHKGYKGRSGSEDVAHFDVVFNLRKPKVQATSRNNYSKNFNLASLIKSIASDPAFSQRGLQGIHAEVMRRLASRGTTAFVSYADVRATWSRIKMSLVSA